MRDIDEMNYKEKKELITFHILLLYLRNALVNNEKTFRAYEIINF